MNCSAVCMVCKESGFYAGTVVLMIPMPSLEQSQLGLAKTAQLVALVGGKTKSLRQQLENARLRF